MFIRDLNFQPFQGTSGLFNSISYGNTIDVKANIFICLTICIIGGGNSRKLPVSVKGVNFTCPIINIETIGEKKQKFYLSYCFYKCHNCSCYV